ncbi:thioredoxin domain-containing protein [Manganibacter manganicus]|uniref:Thioredoxin domain protein n=1 Tax=Manganibacter manganicus TaxID=1873176 RepID=A0A1V8RLF8_9HYPH|nr:thioredoxin domain-containing protein [Pseudaminobacter manganicus]OQM74038.1 thioredoxin domain protein [Pseudaminobacter manganicus]
MPLPPENLLAAESSPYLRQHSANPVHWRAWSAAALREAQELDRPILLSIGYAACHWCHVMAHESFENEDVAAVMNRLFVNIKVDREERPDLDQIYMAALAAMGEQGGWPLTMFLTPDGKPFWGGTYFPPEARYGRPGFIQVLEAVDKAWREKRQSLTQSADGLTVHVGERLAASRDRASLDIDTLTTLAESIDGMMDRTLGGLRGAPKFPNTPFMTTLWLSWLETRNREHRDRVLHSLETMLAGGIYDHIGGGLARYSTDAEWLVPHFEKMLYDNAQLLRLGNWVYAETGNELFRVRIEESIAWLLREMLVDDGAFASSLDADSEGHEGLFYTWDRDELAAVLGSDIDIFNRYITLSNPENWEGKPILRQTLQQQADSIADSDTFTPLKQRLRSAREERVRPGRDEKVLTDWNGLAITALADGGRLFARSDWVDVAAAAFNSITGSARAGRLPHSRLKDAALFPALSSDYAAMINAAIALYEATHQTRYIKQARDLCAQLDRWHGDDAGTGYYLSTSDAEDVPLRIRGDVDEAIPSATAQIVEALARLANVTGDIELHAKAWAVAEHAAGRARHQSYGQAGIVNACALVIKPLKLVVVDETEDSKLVSVANRIPDPRRVDHFVPIGATTDLPLLPGAGEPPTKKPGAYLCTGPVCLPVITDPVKLEAALRET